MLELIIIFILVLITYRLGAWEGERRVLEAWEIHRELEMELLEKLLLSSEVEAD